MRWTVRAVAALAAAALLLVGCGSKPKSNTTSAAPKFKACMVLDTGGVDDRSFNQSSWGGMLAAKKDTGASIQYVPSNSGNDYVPNISSYVQKKCNLIVSVGGLMNQATAQAAKANPTFHFAEVDAPSAAPNMYGMQFNTAQGAFLAGYLAAAMTKTGKVAEFGGLAISPVTVYMDGYWEGVQYYNKQKGKHVQVLGWNEYKPSGGSIVGGPNAFIDQSAGKRIATNFIQQGADIIFPVAGGTGLGAAAAAEQSSGKVSVIWVDFDGCFSVQQYCNVFLTSVYKSITPAVQNAVDSAAKGHFLPGNYLGTLANNGTGLSPFHDFASKVPASLQAELVQLKQQITAGTIMITSPNQPKP